MRDRFVWPVALLLSAASCDCGGGRGGGGEAADAGAEEDAGDGTCRNTADCPPLHTCISMTCRGLPGAPCVSEDDCFRGLFCVDDECSETPPEEDAGRADVPGIPCGLTSECDDSSDCTVDSCVAMRCVNTLNDADLDGYAPRLAGDCGQDCNDADENARPGQTMWFSTSYDFLMMGATFDWNCDGIQERRYLAVLACSLRPDSTCPPGEGWIGGAPGCGGTADWGRCVSDGGGGCTTETIEAGRTQVCR